MIVVCAPATPSPLSKRAPRPCRKLPRPEEIKIQLWITAGSAEHTRATYKEAIKAP